MTDTSSQNAEPTELYITPGPLVGPVLRRVVGMLAARADLPLDRLDDAVLVADVVADRAGPYSTDAIQVSFEPGERRLLMRIGPLRSGGARALLSEDPEVGSIIVKLADEVHIDAQANGGDEYVRVCLAYDG